MKPYLQNRYTLSSVPQSKGLILFVHGLTSSQDEPIFREAERFFNEKQYSTFRFSFYGDLEGERKLTDITLHDHITDVNNIIHFLSLQGFSKIFLVGHSYGGIVNLYVNHDMIAWILMWDSSLWGEGLLNDVYLDQQGKYYIDRWNGYRFYINENFYKDFQISSEVYLKKIKGISLPIKIMAAEYGLVQAAKKYYESAQDPKELSLVTWADHRFLEHWMDSLLQESLEWIEKL